MSECRDPRDWLIQKDSDEEWSQYRIRDEISRAVKISQPTVSRNIDSVKAGGQPTKKMREALEALFLHYDEEAEMEARQKAEHEAERQALLKLERAAAIEQARIERNEREAKEELYRQRIQQEREERAARLHKECQEKARARATVVVRRLMTEGIQATDDRIIHGDGATLVRNGLADFVYKDKRAETIAFAPDEHRFSDGWTAKDLREGVTLEERMRGTAVPAGANRPAKIGLRDARMVTRQACYDEPWFWGESLARDLGRWRSLFATRPSWALNGVIIPLVPTEDDVAWYAETLTAETDLLKRGLQFEQSILGWGDRWKDEVGEKRASLRAIKRRITGRKLTTKVGGVSAAVVVGAVALWHIGKGALIAGDWLLVKAISGGQVAVPAVSQAVESTATIVVATLTSPFWVLAVSGLFALSLKVLPEKRYTVGPDREREICIRISVTLGVLMFFSLSAWGFTFWASLL